MASTGIAVDPFADVRRHLVGLRTWAPTVAAVPSWRPLDPFSAAQCDFYDHRVFVYGKTASELHVTSRAGQPKVRRGDAWARLRDEQMFQLALETGLF